ncbi:MAG: serine hydrolase domain-containing protein [Pseudomonadales bacterium]
MLKKTVLVLGVLVLAAGAYAYSYVRDLAAITSGYVSQTLCTNVLMIGRDKEEVETLDLSAKQHSFTTSTIMGDRVETTAQMGPVSYTTTSVYRPGLGCSNIAGWPLEEVQAIGLKTQLHESEIVSVWPAVEANVPSGNTEKLTAAVNSAFTETTDNVYEKKNTRAVLVHHKGKLIAERYAKGFDGETPLRSMSMTKSATSALVGILVGQGKLDIHKPAPVDGWSEVNDPRSQVTTHHLLKMIAGFDYNEAYEKQPRNLLSVMLMSQPDMAAFAAQTPLLAEPGNSWDYQTTHSVLLQRVIRSTIGDDQAYFRFPQEELFNKLGMRNSFFQADASGTFSGGAFMYASGRDWMKLGLLYLNDGVHNGERVLPEGWVEYSTTPSEPSLQKRAYGAQIWLNAPAPEQLFPGLPEDAFAFQGHYGQYVVVIPSLQLVVVRMGMTYENGDFDKLAFLKDIIAALPQGIAEA